MLQPAVTAARRPWLARLLLIVWLAVAAVTIYVTVAGLPLRFAELRVTSPVVWSSGAVEYVDQQLHPLEGAVLTNAGLGVADYAAYIVLLELLLTVLFFVWSVLIVRQRADEWLAVMIAIALLCIGLTEPAIDGALIAVQPFWYEPLEVMQAFGLLIAFALAFLVFPDGRFTPRWTRAGLVFAASLMTAWVIFPDLPFNPTGPSFERTPIASTLFTGALIAAGVLAQVQRYRSYATPLQKRQILAGTFGFVMLFVAEVVRSLSYALTIPQEGPGALTLAVNIARYPVFILLVLFLPLGFGVAILRHQLWNFDLVLRRTALYSLLTAAGFGVYVLIVVVSSLFFDSLGGFGSLWFTAASALASALLLLPVYRFAQRRIDHLFNRRWLDFQAELTRFSRSVRTRLSSQAIADELSGRVAELMGSEGVALAVRAETSQVGGQLYQLHPIHSTRPPDWSALLATHAARLQRGEAVVLGSGGGVELLVPLLAQRAERSELVGVLLCGPRRTGQPYERADVALLTGMADQAASALLVAELVESERRLEQHRNSPLGQAEALADSSPDAAALQAGVLALFEQAVADPLAAQQLGHLPGVLRSQGLAELGLLAEGCHLLVNGREDAASAVAGLQRIDRYLAETADDGPETAGNRTVLAFCLAGLAAQNLEDIRAALVTEDSGQASLYFAETGAWIERLAPLGLALDKHRRSPGGDDRLVYLVDGLSLCSALHAQAAQAETPATTVITPLLAQWNQILVDALRRERERVAVTLLPLTSRVLPHRSTVLVLQVHNEGWRALEEVVVAIEMNGTVRSGLAEVAVGGLAPGGRARLHFPVTVTASGPFSVSFRLTVVDSEQQRASYSVALPFEALGGGRPFRPIPNPYVTGAPLRAGSPLFVGRADDLAFLHGALGKGPEAPAVVLTGPKRMGKTSLLNRLTGTLDDSTVRAYVPVYVPVYVDVQGIGYAPGLGNLLLDIAAEAARALGLPWPPADTGAADSPEFFTQTFLPQARQALGERRLLFLLDEFEELEQRVASGLLGGEVFGFLRHTVQHQPQLAWVFVGTNGLADLPPTHWSGLFSGAAHRRVGLLDPSNARRLIVEPVQGFLDYDDLALDKLLQLSGGHPYFLQVLCHALVLDANRSQQVIVAGEDVEAAAPKALEMAEAHLLALWRALSPAEMAVARAAARLLDARQPVTAETLTPRLPVEPGETIGETLTALEGQGVLALDGQGSYRFVLDLQRRWVGKGDWGSGIGDWGFGNPSPIPSPQSPIP